LSWQLAQGNTHDKAQLCQSLVDVHRHLYKQYFRGELGVNDRLPIQVRAYRAINSWHVCLVLTPWMLARHCIPMKDPRLAIPATWSAEARKDRAYVVIGPRLELQLLGSFQQAYLNFDPTLGHYLLQPLVQSMDRYTSADEVFHAWDTVIKIRDENIRKAQKDCPWQREISRRELLARAWTHES